MEFNTNLVINENMKRKVEIPKREYNFEKVLNIFKEKENFNFKVTEKRQVLEINQNRKYESIKPKNLSLSLKETNNTANKLEICKSDGLTDAQFLRQMFGGLAQELEGAGPSCRVHIPIFKVLGAPPKKNCLKSNRFDDLPKGITLIYNEPNIPQDETVKGKMFEYSCIKKFWADKTKK